MTATTPTPTYDAFLSYSRDDQSKAIELQRRLERLGRRRSELPAIRVFRDETDLTTTDDLIKALSDHIDASNAFVVLCSPSAAGSDFVAAEIDLWRRAKPDRPIVLALVDGELEWDAAGGRFDPERSTALPPNLIDHYPSLPTWISVTDASGALTDDGIHQVAAVVLGRDLREIRAEEQRIQRRQLRITRAVAAVVAGLALLAGLAFLDSRRSAEEAADQRDIAQSQALAGQASALFDEDPDLAMLLAVEADRLVSTPESQSALLDVAFRGGDLGLVSWGADESGTFVAAAYNPDDEVLFVSLLESTDLLRADFSAPRPAFEIVGSPGDSVTRALGYDPEQAVLVGVEESGSVVTRDPETGAIRSVEQLGSTVFGAALSADAASFAAVVAPDGQTLVVLTGPTDNPSSASTTPLPFEPAALAVSPQRRMVIASGAGDVAVWNPAEGQWTQWLENRIPVVAAFSRDDRQLATGSREGGVRLYDVTGITPSAVGQAPGPNQSSPVSFAVTDIPTVGHAGEVQGLAAGDRPEGIAFWSIGSDGQALAWSPDNTVIFGPIRLAHGGSATFVAPLPADSGLLTAGRDSSAQRYQGPEGGPVYRGAPYVDPVAAPDEFAESFVTISPRNGRSSTDSTVGIRGDGEAVRIMVGEQGRSAATPLGFNVGQAAEFLAMAEAPDGSRLAVAGRRGTGGEVSVWDVEEGTLVGRIPTAGWTSGLDFTDEDTLYVVDQVYRGLTVVEIDDDGLVVVDEIDAPSGQTPAPFRNGSVAVDAAGEGPDRVVVVSYGLASQFMVVRNGEANEYDLGVPIQQIEAIAVAPSTETAALALSDGRIFLWDLVEERTVGRPLDVTQGRILAIAFYDDETLVTGGRNGWVGLWNTTTGFQIGEQMNPHRIDVTGITVSPETSSILTVSIANTVRWDLDRDTWSAGICNLVQRDLTETEWQRFLPDRDYRPTCTAGE